MPETKQPKALAPLGEVVYERLTDMIISGEVAPGDRLRELQIATQFGTSRVPVREALQRLADDGWIVRVHGAGARVTTPTRTDVDELFDLRRILEAEAVRLAVRHLSLGSAESIRAHITAAHEAVDRNDSRAIAEANRRFHAEIAELSNSKLLCKILHDLERRVQWMFAFVAINRANHSLKEHSDLIDAMLDRDVTLAVKITEHHVESTREALYAHWRPAPTS